jgi:pimeloyl-ACP methyl ester carboxylesterase
MHIYFEEHGDGPGRPLVLVHGALSGIGTSFGPLLPLLSRTRRVIALELPGHGRTPDLDRPLTVENFAGDVVGLLDRLGLPAADVFGWGLGAAVALHLGTAVAERVGRLVLASVSFDRGGLHPGLLDGIQDLRPEHLHGSELHDEYLRLAPDPAGWHRLVTRMKALDANPPEWTPAQIRALVPPVLIVAGDSDIVRPEHAMRMFRLLGGGVAGDLAGLPRCRLAILPGTTHTSLPHRAALLAPMVEDFLDEEAFTVAGPPARIHRSVDGRPAAVDGRGR